MTKQKSKQNGTPLGTDLQLTKKRALQLISDWMNLIGIEETSDKFITVRKRPTNGDREQAKLKRIIGSIMLISTSRRKEEDEQERITNRIENLDRVVNREELITTILKTLT